MKKLFSTLGLVFLMSSGVALAKPNADDMAASSVFHIGGRDGQTTVCRINKLHGVYIQCDEFEGRKKVNTSISKVEVNCRGKTYAIDGAREKFPSPNDDSSANAFALDLYEAACLNKYSRVLKVGSTYHDDGHVGRWGNIAFKGSCGPDSDSAVVITKKSISKHEDHCDVKQWRRGANSFTYTGSCSVEGEDYKPNETWRTVGDDFIMNLTPDGMGDVYARCSK